MRSIIVVGAAVCLAAGPVEAQRPSLPPPAEMVHIDGSRNPELIPQWSAWGFAFRIFSGGPRELPSPVMDHLSPEEAALILQESDAIQKVDADCIQRLLKTHERLQAGEAMKAVDQKMHAITVECRWETLRARDRILKGINPNGQIALLAYVESTKKGTKVVLPRSGLARYLEPE